MSEPSEPENEKQDAGDVVSGDVVSDGVVTGDADWKAKAQREKEELDKTLDSEERPELPPASFLGLVEELSLRSMIALGQIPNPLTGKQDTDLEAARYTIDLLGVLEEKTKGNLEASEAQAVTDVVAQLRREQAEAFREAGLRVLDDDAPCRLDQEVPRVGDAAADGASVAYRAIGDLAGNEGQEPDGCVGQRAVLDGGMDDAGADE